jgi:SAM-dependent methyltransferase
MNSNRFQDFFEEGKYVALKNYLYNYQLRKHAIERILAGEDYARILEVGSGISPVMTQTDRIVYSELSFLACRTLKRRLGRGWFVTADATRLPFCDGAFSHTVSSEVFEHIPNDREAIQELARVTSPGGRLIVTFPHRKFYFTNDDRFVQHFRRYELADMTERLEAAHAVPLKIEKVLGPVEKLAMMFTIFCVQLFQAVRPQRDQEEPAPPSILIRAIAPLFILANRIFAWVAWIDARLIPQSLASVLLIVAEKKQEPR